MPVNALRREPFNGLEPTFMHNRQGKSKSKYPNPKIYSTNTLIFIASSVLESLLVQIHWDASILH